MAIKFLVFIGILFLLGYLVAWRTREKVRRLQDEGVYPQDGAEKPADVDRLLLLGHKTEAIKVYRQLHGVGLKEAKHAVEARAREIDPRFR